MLLQLADALRDVLDSILQDFLGDLFLIEDVPLELKPARESNGQADFNFLLIESCQKPSRMNSAPSQGRKSLG